MIKKEKNVTYEDMYNILHFLLLLLSDGNFSRDKSNFCLNEELCSQPFYP